MALSLSPALETCLIVIGLVAGVGAVLVVLRWYWQLYCDLQRLLSRRRKRGKNKERIPTTQSQLSSLPLNNTKPSDGEEAANRLSSSFRPPRNGDTEEKSNIVEAKDEGDSVSSSLNVETGESLRYLDGDQGDPLSLGVSGQGQAFDGWHKQQQRPAWRTKITVVSANASVDPVQSIPNFSTSHVKVFRSTGVQQPQTPLSQQQGGGGSSSATVVSHSSDAKMLEKWKQRAAKSFNLHAIDYNKKNNKSKQQQESRLGIVPYPHDDAEDARQPQQASSMDSSAHTAGGSNEIDVFMGCRLGIIPILGSCHRSRSNSREETIEAVVNATKDPPREPRTNV